MLVVPAYAKVNLSLEVTGRRPDGWHDIASVVCTIDWHDLVGIAIDRAEADDGATDPGAGTDGVDRGPGDGTTARGAHTRVRVRLSGPFAEGIPTGGGNLAARAATALLDLAGPPAAHLAISIWL